MACVAIKSLNSSLIYKKYDRVFLREYQRSQKRKRKASSNLKGNKNIINTRRNLNHKMIYINHNIIMYG